MSENMSVYFFYLPILLNSVIWHIPCAFSIRADFISY